VISYDGKDFAVPVSRGNSGDYAALIRSWLTNIMYGKEDHPWGVVIKEE
jgi:branched-chain amino acid aminotransferase